MGCTARPYFLKGKKCFCTSGCRGQRLLLRVALSQKFPARGAGNVISQRCAVKLDVTTSVLLFPQTEPGGERDSNASKPNPTFKAVTSPSYGEGLIMERCSGKKE